MIPEGRNEVNQYPVALCVTAGNLQRRYANDSTRSSAAPSTALGIVAASNKYVIHDQGPEVSTNG